MKCHYEVLEIPRHADEAEIKTAYKKMALRWHPDKNMDHVDEAKEQFQLVQQAYEVLSDRQERAWYDSHREQILRSADADNSKKEDVNLFNVFPYFTTCCFCGHGDDENGFYAVYRRVFDCISKEDLPELDIDDKEDFLNIPTFGDSASDYEQIVNPFYSYWIAYNTRKTYNWLDERIPKEYRDRRVIKLIEKESKKIRAKAKKERNEEVRSLVEFVRKRDKRVKANIARLQERAEANRKKQEQISRERRIEQRRSNMSEEQAEWTKFHNVREQLEEIERNLGTDSDDDDDDSDGSGDDSVRENDPLLCVACNKLFKTHKSFENHEKSKKHQENVAILKNVLHKEEEAFIKIDNDVQSDANDLPEELDAANYDGNDSMTSKKNKKKGKNKVLSTFDADVEDLDDSTATTFVITEGEHVHCNVANDTVANSQPTAKIKKKRRKDKNQSQPDNICNENIVEEGKPIMRVDSSQVIEAVCSTCKNSFASNNKLFAHLRKTGHAQQLA